MSFDVAIALRLSLHLEKRKARKPLLINNLWLKHACHCS